MFFLKAKLTLKITVHGSLSTEGIPASKSGHWSSVQYHFLYTISVSYLQVSTSYSRTLDAQSPTCLPSNTYLPIVSFSSPLSSRIFFKTSNLIGYFHYTVHIIPVASCKSPTFNLKPKWSNIFFRTSCLLREHFPFFKFPLFIVFNTALMFTISGGNSFFIVFFKGWNSKIYNSFSLEQGPCV